MDNTPEEPKIGEIAPMNVLKRKYEKYGLMKRPAIKLDPENVPSEFRELIPYAEKWGIGDDLIRDDFESKTSKLEKEELGKALEGKTKAINEWLDSFGSGHSMTDEAEAFRYMLEAAAEMDVYPKE